MKNKVVWIGTKESDILHTNHFFSNSITACGSGKSHNISFQLYNYALDWLYLISAIKFDEKEGVIKCF